jgi:IS5 family transposase
MAPNFRPDEAISLGFALREAGDFFSGRSDHLIDLTYRFAVPGLRMLRQEIETWVEQPFARLVCEGKRIAEMDLLGPDTQLVGVGGSPAGRSWLPMRLIIWLLFLKYAFDESADEVFEPWNETPLRGYLSKKDYYEHRRPCDLTALLEFRRPLGQARSNDSHLRHKAGRYAHARQSKWMRCVIRHPRTIAGGCSANSSRG